MLGVQIIFLLFCQVQRFFAQKSKGFINEVVSILDHFKSFIQTIGNRLATRKLDIFDEIVGTDLKPKAEN